MALPLLAIPLASVVTAGGVGFAAGSWYSNGWVKWAIILVIVLVGYVSAKRLGVFD